MKWPTFQVLYMYVHIYMYIHKYIIMCCIR